MMTVAARQMEAPCIHSYPVCGLFMSGLGWLSALSPCDAMFSFCDDSRLWRADNSTPSSSRCLEFPSTSSEARTFWYFCLRNNESPEMRPIRDLRSTFRSDSVCELGPSASSLGELVSTIRITWLARRSLDFKSLQEVFHETNHTIYQTLYFLLYSAAMLLLVLGSRIIYVFLNQPAREAWWRSATIMNSEWDLHREPLWLISDNCCPWDWLVVHGSMPKPRLLRLENLALSFLLRNQIRRPANFRIYIHRKPKDRSRPWTERAKMPSRYPLSHPMHYLVHITAAISSDIRNSFGNTPSRPFRSCHPPASSVSVMDTRLYRPNGSV